MEILDRGLTPEEAAAVAGWAYPPPYDLYDASESSELADYHPVVREGELVGFVCLGEHARVPGQWEAHDAVDVGAGFEVVRRFTGPDGRSFVEMIRPAG